MDLVFVSSRQKLLISVPAMAQNAEPEFTLDIGTIAPDNTPWAQQLQELDERFERESNGRLRVRVFLGSPDGELSLVRQCQDGTYQAVGVSTGAVANVVPQMGVFELPYLFGSVEEADGIIDNILYDPIGAVLRENGFQLYLFSENGMRNFATSGVEVHQPSDLSSIQMRVQESWINQEM